MRWSLWAISVSALGAWLASIPAQDAPAYTAPKADGPVVTLLDEETDALFPLLNNAAAGEPGTVTREDRDVFAGVEAVRVTPLQKYQPNIPGWAFKIVETPKVAGEFRHVRFAWKKFGGSGVMVQLHDSDKQGWGLRFFAGANPTGWGSRSVGEKMPTEWQVVTRDLFQDFGAVTVTGLALTAMDGEAALFDHVLLGRTVADLDRATNEALGRVTPIAPLQGKERDILWEDLNAPDRKKAAVALRAFLASAPDQVSYIRDHMPRPDPATTARVRKLVADFGADEFETRRAAVSELVRIGAPCLPEVRESAKSNDAEISYRARMVLNRLRDVGQGNAPAARVVRVLERAGTPEARELLKKFEAGAYGSEYSTDAKAALARLIPSPSPAPK